MSHARSRLAFAAVNHNDSLLRLYCEMVGLELILKDRLPEWTSGHDVYSLLLGHFDATVDTLATQLRQSLGLLACTDRRGGASVVDIVNYPGIRYLHRAGDIPDGATDIQLDLIRDILSDLYQQLNDMHGVRP